VLRDEDPFTGLQVLLVGVVCWVNIEPGHPDEFVGAGLRAAAGSRTGWLVG